MPRTSPLARAVVAGAAFVASCAPAKAPRAEPGASAEAYLAAPFLSDLVASKRGDRIAWLADDRGEHQVWTAQGPAFAPKLVAHWAGDDGRPLGDLAIADDGARVVFVRGAGEGGTVNPTSDPRGGKSEIWIADASGASAPVLAGEGTSPTFRPDGHGLVFRADDDLHAMAIDPPRDAATLKVRGKEASLRWSPDGARFAFVSDRGDHSWVGVSDAAGTRVTWLAPSVDRDDAPAWSPDGKRVAFLRFRGATADAPLDVEVFALTAPVSVVVADATSGEGRVVVAEDASGGFAQSESRVPLLWSDDDRLVFPSERDGWQRLWSARADGAGAPTAITPAGCEAEAQTLAADRRSIVVATNCGDVERRHLFVVPAAGGATRAITPGHGVEWSPVVTTSGAIAYVGSSARDLPAITVVASSGAPRRITESAAQRHAPSLVEPQPVTFRAADGGEVHAELFLPPPDKRAAKMPALVFAHGGPVRQMLAGWHPMGFYHWAYAMNQLFAARGYAVLAVNYRLGVGYGRAFRRAPGSGPFGSSEYADVLAAGRWLAARADVDPARVGMWGGSYGGLLTALALARDSSTFRAGVDLCGVHDWTREIKEAVHAEDALRVARASSPVASVAQWTSPVLFVHGDDDHAVAFGQTVDLVRRLRDAGHAHVELMILPDEQHGSAIHAHWVAIAQRAGDFFDRTLPAR